MKNSHEVYPLRIGLVFGGASAEHEVSIASAKNLRNALEEGTNRERYEVTSLYIDKEGHCWPSAIAQRIMKQETTPYLSNFSGIPGHSGFRGFPEGTKDINVWFPALHGPNGEDGTIQGLFTLMRKRFIGANVLGSAVSMDKQAMKASFSSAKLPQVLYSCVHVSELHSEPIMLLSRLEKQLGYPCFVKPANMGSSLGISKCNNRDELIRGLKLASEYDNRLVVEQAKEIREIECAVMGKEKLRVSILGEIRFSSDWYDYETKYKDGNSFMTIPAQLPKSITETARRLALEACRALGVSSIARVDFFYSEEHEAIWINEINTLPGFTNYSMYPTLWKRSGLSTQDLVHLLIKLT
ncbi:MAG TPA: D-alanine--D-alanine ligase family protein [Prochlorococcaceae cyanobacterium AMR_MDS_5431]|nr:D-alanine--D-alanine ligase family protein [Prochlorococcaceae cyanobacterium AMR_MDS_5431]